MRRNILLGMVLTIAACGSPTGDTPPTSGGDTTTTTISTTTTTTSSTTTTPSTVPLDPTTEPTQPDVDFVYTGEIKELPGSEGALGSGCNVGSDLPDGVWFGLARAWTATEVEFDLACWYSGEQAEAVGAARGEEVTNDYLIVNDNLSRRLVPVAEFAVAWRLNDDVSLKLVEYEDLLEDPGAFAPCPSEFCAVWLFVNEGMVTEVLRQYQP